MTCLRALLWDVDGTLAETERDGHRVAFNQAFEQLQLPWRWSEAHYGGLLQVTGGRERLMHDMASRSDAPATSGERDRLARELHRLKNGFYAEIVHASALPLRPGVAALVDQARAAGMRQAIVTTTSRSNVDALLGRHWGTHWREIFAVQVCGEDVQRKKPDPQAYALACTLLQLPPLQTLAIEDSPGGVAAACGAGVPVVVPRSAYFLQAAIEGAIAIGPGLGQLAGWQPRRLKHALPRPEAPAEARCDDPQGGVTLEHLRGWHAEADIVSSFA
ncbi:MAG: HAD-IA family hydrolase [Rubrivivax sp.]|nr:HAD-IA family hydrolase [Rubrivivax sp.]